MRIPIAMALVMTVSVSIATELPIGSVRFKLGADQSSVMKQAEATFHVVSVSGQSDMFFLSESKPPNVEVIGGISFKNGRLTWIQRTWGNFHGEAKAADIAKAIFAAIESATVASGSDATITTALQRVPGLEFRTINYQFPGRKVTVTTTEGDSRRGGSQVSIEESVSSAEP